MKSEAVLGLRHRLGSVINELLAEEQSNSDYLVTIGKLGLTPMEVAIDTQTRVPAPAPVSVSELLALLKK
jgi:hypothetical protein